MAFAIKKIGVSSMTQRKITAKITKHAIYIVSVLTAYLIKEFVVYILGNFKKVNPNKYVSVLIGMLLVVLIFYPVYELLKTVSKHLVHEYFKKSKEITNSQLGGVAFGFVTLVILLFGVYSYLWQKVNIIRDAQSWLGL